MKVQLKRGAIRGTCGPHALAIYLTPLERSSCGAPLRLVWRLMVRGYFHVRRKGPGCLALFGGALTSACDGLGKIHELIWGPFVRETLRVHYHGLLPDLLLRPDDMWRRLVVSSNVFYNYYYYYF